MVQRVDDDISDMVRLRNMGDDVDEMMVKAVKVARRKGVTWERIATALGVTRQAANAKYRPLIGESIRSRADKGVARSKAAV